MPFRFYGCRTAVMGFRWLTSRRRNTNWCVELHYFHEDENDVSMYDVRSRFNRVAKLNFTVFDEANINIRNIYIYLRYCDKRYYNIQKHIYFHIHINLMGRLGQDINSVLQTALMLAREMHEHWIASRWYTAGAEVEAGIWEYGNMEWWVKRIWCSDKHKLFRSIDACLRLRQTLAHPHTHIRTNNTDKFTLGPLGVRRAPWPTA